MEEKQQQNTPKRSIFRREAMDRISSPEELDGYLKVTGPGVWLPLLAVIVLLIGAFFWLVLGRITVTVNVAVKSTGNAVICYVPEEHRQAAAGGTVRIGEKEYPLKEIGQAPLMADENMDAQLYEAGGYLYGTRLAPLQVEGELIEGVYEGKLAVEAVRPIKYIMN